MGNSTSRDERTKAFQLKFDKNDIPAFKVVLIGEPNSGKTSVFLRYARNQFDFNYRPTKRAYVENVMKKINLPNDMVAGITLWDLPGQEDMDLRESYYRNADAAIVVVDMMDESSIELASAWKQEFLNKVSRVRLSSEPTSNGVMIAKHEKLHCDRKSIPVLLLGNKYDLVEEQLREEKLKSILQQKRQTAIEDEEEHAVIPELPPELDAFMRGDDADETGSQTSEDSDEEYFFQQRGPRRHEKKPECVQLLEKVARQHNFVGSVMVSAKDGDNSVHAAVQSLVRFLIDKAHPITRVKKKALVKRRRAIVQEEEHKTFAETGSKELDHLFRQCVVPLKRSTDYVEFYNTVLRRWKQCCLDHSYLMDVKASLEDTIIGFRDRIREHGHELQLRENDEAMELYIKKKSSSKIPSDVPVALRVFNTEYAVMCTIILRDAPAIQNYLNNLDNKIDQKSKELWEGRNAENEKFLEHVMDVCERNRARIWMCRSHNEEVLTTVENARTKISTALVW